MPAGYGYIDPLHPINSLPDSPTDNPGGYLNKEKVYWNSRVPDDLSIESPPGLIRNGSELTIDAMPSIRFQNSVLIGYSYVFMRSQRLFAIKNTTNLA